VSAGICRECNGDIVWARTEKGQRIPLDPARLSRDDETANQAVYRDHLGALRTRVPSAENPIANHEWRAMPHFATCPARTAARDAQAGRIPNVIPLTRRTHR
jgi:hypothetical protein